MLSAGRRCPAGTRRAGQPRAVSALLLFPGYLLGRLDHDVGKRRSAISRRARGVCDSAGPPRLQSRSEAAPEAAKIGLAKH